MCFLCVKNKRHNRSRFKMWTKNLFFFYHLLSTADMLASSHTAAAAADGPCLSPHTWTLKVVLLNTSLHCTHTYAAPTHTHTNTNPSKHPLPRPSIPLCLHTQGDSVARLPWKPGWVYQPALPLAGCGSRVLVCVWCVHLRGCVWDCKAYTGLFFELFTARLK